MATDYLDMNLLGPTDINDYEEGSRHRVYSLEELKIINKFKDKYMAATSSTERKNCAQLEMFPKLFNYWKDNGKIYDQDQTKIKSNVSWYYFVLHFNFIIIKEFLQWLRNTWRPDKDARLTKSKQYRLGDVLWWLHQDEVLKEIGRIKGKDSIDTTTPGWFEHRTTATKNILANMIDSDREELQRKAAEMALKGLPDDIKRK